MKYKSIFFALSFIALLLSVNTTFGQKNKNDLLFEAVKSNNIELVKQLVGKKANVNAVDADGASILMWAAYSGDLEMVKFLVSKKADYHYSGGVIYTSPEKTGYYGNLLGIVSSENKPDILRYFIEELQLDIEDLEYNPSTGKKDGWNALQWAVYQANIEIIDYLIEKGANINANNGTTALIISLYNSNISHIGKFLIGKGADVNMVDDKGWSAIHYYALSRIIDVALFQMMMNKGADINARITKGKYLGWTPLILAVMNHNYELVKILIDTGAEIELQTNEGKLFRDIFDVSGNALLNMAVEYKDTELIELLLLKGVDINQLSNDGLSALHISAFYGNDAIVKLLIDKGADVNIQSRNTLEPGWTPLMYAALFKEYSVFDTLLKAGADIDIKTADGKALWEIINDYGMTALQVAAENGNSEFIKLLLLKGADPGIKDDKGYTAFHYAAKNNAIRAAYLLLESGADANALTSDGLTVLEIAKNFQMNDVVFLLENPEKHKIFALYELNRFDEILSCIKLNPELINLQNTDNRTILHRAVEDNNVEFVKKLLIYKPDINLIDNRHETSLLKACSNSNEQIASVLLNNGANPNINDAYGYSPLYFANMHGNKILIDVLKQKNANKSFSAAHLIIPIGHKDDVSTFAMTPDGKILATGSEDNMVKLWDTESGKLLKTFLGHESHFDSVSFSNDGRKFVSNSIDGIIKIWDIQSGKCLKTLVGQMAVLSPNGTQALIVSDDQILKLININNGSCLKSFYGHTKNITSLAFSYDGTKILSGSQDKTIKLWQVQSGKCIHTFTGHEESIISVAFSPDDSKIVSVSNDKTIKSWDIQSGECLTTISLNLEWYERVSISRDGSKIFYDSLNMVFKIWDLEKQQCIDTVNHDEGIINASFSPDATKIVYTFYDPEDTDISFLDSKIKSIRLFDIESEKILMTFEGDFEPAQSMICSPDGSKIVSISGNLIKIWDTRKGGLLDTLSSNVFDFNKITISPDGKKILSGSTDGIKQWDSDSRNEIRTFPTNFTEVKSLIFSPDGTKILYGVYADTLKLLDTETGICLKTYSGFHNLITTTAFSPDGSKIVHGSSDGTLRIWDTESGNCLYIINEHQKEISSVEFSPDGSKVISGSYDGTIRLWDVSTGKCIKIFSGNQEFFVWVAFTPDGHQILSCSTTGTFNLWDIQSGISLNQFQGYDDIYGFESTAFSRVSSKIYCYSKGNSLKIMDLENFKELATIVFVENDIVITSPTGLFDASPGVMDKIYYVSGLEIIELNQLKERFYEPGLLQKILNNEELRNVQGFNEIKLPPDIEILPIENNSLRINLKNKMNGGIGKVKVFAGGKEIIEDARYLVFKTEEEIKKSVTKDSLNITIDLGKYESFFIPGMENSISVQAYNGEEFIVSRPKMISYIPPVPMNYKLDEIPNVYIVCIGISDYYGNEIDLRFAAKDAEDMMTALKTGAEGLFGIQKVHTYLWTSPLSTRTDVTQVGLPGKADIENAFLNLSQKVKADDVLIVYLAGHGINIATQGDEGDFYYLTSEAYSSDISSYYDEAIRNKTTIKSSEFVDMLLKQPANKQVLIIDACHSGKAVENLSVQRDISSSTIRAFDRMKDRTGMHIITGSTADAVSYESNQFGQGILTYSLLEGIKGMALREGQFVDVMQLFQNSKERVPVLAGGLGGIQEPVIFSPYLSGKYEKGAESFDIGKISNEDKFKIPLAKSKPMFVLSVFMDAENFSDHLNLGDQADEKLRELTALGTEAPLILIETKDFPGSYKIRGQYTVLNGKLTLKVNVFEEKTIVKSFELIGEMSETDELINNLIEKVSELFK